MTLFLMIVTLAAGILVGLTFREDALLDARARIDELDRQLDVCRHLKARLHEQRTRYKNESANNTRRMATLRRQLDRLLVDETKTCTLKSIRYISVDGLTSDWMHDDIHCPNCTDGYSNNAV